MKTAQKRLKRCVELHKKTQTIQYNGTSYECGVCAFCGQAHFHSTLFMFGSYICPLCNFEFRKAYKLKLGGD